MIEEIEKKIETYKAMRSQCTTKCLEDCKNKMKLSEQQKPSRLRNPFTRTEKKQKMVNELCEQQNTLKQCSDARNSWSSKLCRQVIELEQEIMEMFEAYEQEEKDIAHEERKFRNGLIDIYFQNVDGDKVKIPIRRNATIKEIKKEFEISGDLALGNTLLKEEDTVMDRDGKEKTVDKTIRDYFIKSGATLLVIPPMPSQRIGGAKKRRTVRKTKFEHGR